MSLNNDQAYSTGLVFVHTHTESRLQAALVVILLSSLPGSIYLFIRGFWWLGALLCVMALASLWLGMRAARRKAVTDLNIFTIVQIVIIFLQLGALIFSVVTFFTYEGGWCYGKSYCKDTPPWFWALSFLSFVCSVFNMLAELYALVLAFRLKREVAHDHAAPAPHAPPVAPSYHHPAYPVTTAPMHSGSPYTAAGYPPASVTPTERTRLV